MVAEIRENMGTAGKLPFTEEETAVDEGLGYPRAYAKLCRQAITHGQGPPFAFLPYALQPHESVRAKEFNQMFPVIDPEATSTANPRTYINLLWKQLSHLGNAGFDPALFRVDPHGNVLYFHADYASPLYWDIDHWFPRSRGGRTVLSNLRLLQWQVCKKKHNKLEFFIPWWDLQLGISVNQFLCIFASRNSDFRNRAFSFLFADGSNEELNELQVVGAHKFPQHFVERKRHVGLAPAAIALSERYSDASLLKPLNLKSRPLRPSSPSVGDNEGFGKAIHGSRPSVVSKENDDPNIRSNENNPYFTIALARDSLRERGEAKKKQAEIRGLEDEWNDLKRKNEAERFALQDLEAALIRKRRRVEKCRRLAEAQASYKTQLERMIRDAMHQSVVYREQVRLNQAACSTLVARLEAQKAMCDSSGKELLKKYKQRDDLEKQIIPYCDEQGRKRSWREDPLHEDCGDLSRFSHSTRRKMRKALRKQLRVFLEEEKKASEAGVSFDEDKMERLIEYRNSADDELAAVGCEHKGQVEEGHGSHEPVDDVNQLGKRNVERWLQLLLERAGDDGPSSQVSSPRDVVAPENHSEEITPQLDPVNPHKEIKRLKPAEDKSRWRWSPKCSKEDTSSIAAVSEKSSMGDLGSRCAASKGAESSRSLDVVNGRMVERRPDSLSSRTLRRFPSSPVIVGVRRSMECISKKPLVVGDDDD